MQIGEKHVLHTIDRAKPAVVLKIDACQMRRGGADKQANLQFGRSPARSYRGFDVPLASLYVHLGMTNLGFAVHSSSLCVRLRYLSCSICFSSSFS
jgi:hypothetical protein